MGARVVRMGDKRNAYKILVWKSERKRLFGKSRRRWEDNFTLDLREVEWEVVDSMGCGE